MVRLPGNEKQTHQWNSRPQMWPSGLALAITLTLKFQGQIWNLLYLSQKWCDCHETKGKHIDGSQGLKCDHQVWPWPWPWIFKKVKCGICYISVKMVRLPRDEKQTYRLNSRPQMWRMGLTLAMTLTFEFSRSNVILTISWPRSGLRIYQIVTGWLQMSACRPGLGWSTFGSTWVKYKYFSNLQVQVQVLAVLGKHQVHQVLFQSSTSTSTKYFGNKQ